MMCETYPNMKLVLCHSARGFNMHHVIDSIEQLIGLDNLYFDTVSGRALFSRALVRALRLSGLRVRVRSRKRAPRTP